MFCENWGRVSSNQSSYHRDLWKIKARLYHTVRNNCESNSGYEPVAFDRRTWSLMLSAERTILSPFTKECRAPGTFTGIFSLFGCPPQGSSKENQGGGSCNFAKQVIGNLFDAQWSDLAVKIARAQTGGF